MGIFNGIYRFLYRQEKIYSTLTEVLRQMTKLTDEITFLKEDVAKLETVVDSAIALIEGLADQIEDATGDEAELENLVDELRSQSDELAAAVAAHTVAEEPPPAPEPPVEETPPTEEETPV